jgi:hypothetical protein
MQSRNSPQSEDLRMDVTFGYLCSRLDRIRRHRTEREGGRLKECMLDNVTSLVGQGCDIAAETYQRPRVCRGHAIMRSVLVS